MSFCGEALNAQTYTKVSNVKTPNNSIVQDTWKLTSSDIVYTPAQIAALAADLNSNYNGAELVEAPSYKYNCHAYAWHVSEGGDKVWMGRYTDDAEDIYWTDDSYIEVPEKIATKVSYHRDGNHSAIRLNSNLYESKWGWGGSLVKHGPNDVFSIYQPAKTKKILCPEALHFRPHVGLQSGDLYGRKPAAGSHGAVERKQQQHDVAVGTGNGNCRVPADRNYQRRDTSRNQL